MGGFGSGRKRKTPIGPKEIEAARLSVARALARANREGTDIRCQNSDVKMVLFGIVALMAENAALKKASAIEAGTAETAQTGSVHESAGPQDDARKDPS